MTLDVEREKLTAVMGPSGSGKSTLMHLLAALDRPTSGYVTIAGTRLGNLSDNEVTLLRREHIGFIFQFFNLLPMLTAEENIVLPLSLAGEKPEKEFFDDLLDKVGLNDRRTHRPAELSGGQQQRVAIARALVSRPTVVFADEPTGNLDSKTGGEILELLRSSVRDYGQTLVMVTHDSRAAATADRILFLADGEIVKELHGADEHEVLDGDRADHPHDDAVALRGMAGRKLRAVLTAFAIVLGVAMMSGAYVLTDTIDKAFDTIFVESYAGTDAVVTGKSATSASRASRRRRRRSPRRRSSGCAASTASRSRPARSRTSRRSSCGRTARRSTPAARRRSPSGSTPPPSTTASTRSTSSRAAGRAARRGRRRRGRGRATRT